MFRLVLLAVLVCLGMSGAQASDVTTPTGRWITQDQRAVIQITPCGADLCGQIVGIALAHPGDPMPTDWQGKPQCGEMILQTAPAVSESGGKTWIGRVLDPRDGAIYQARMALDALRHLVLHGYVGLPIFGRTQTWTPYAGRTTADCRLAVVAASVGGAG